MCEISVTSLVVRNARCLTFMFDLHLVIKNLFSSCDSELVKNALAWKCFIKCKERHHLFSKSSIY